MPNVKTKPWIHQATATCIQPSKPHCKALPTPIHKPHQQNPTPNHQPFNVLVQPKPATAANAPPPIPMAAATSTAAIKPYHKPPSRHQSCRNAPTVPIDNRPQSLSKCPFSHFHIPKFSNYLIFKLSHYPINPITTPFSNPQIPELLISPKVRK